MKRLFLKFVLLACIMLNFSLAAQRYQSAFAINPTDSFQITASALFPNSEIVVASQEQLRNAPGGSGIIGLSSALGEIVLRRLDQLGNPMWEIEFPNSLARILHVKITSAGDILLCGAFHDTLQFSPNNTIYSEQFRSNAFMACYDGQGNFKWVYSTAANPSYSKYYYTFDIRQNKIYLPYNPTFSGETRVRILDMQGDSINDFQLGRWTTFHQPSKI